MCRGTLIQVVATMARRAYPLSIVGRGFPGAYGRETRCAPA